MRKTSTLFSALLCVCLTATAQHNIKAATRLQPAQAASVRAAESADEDGGETTVKPVTEIQLGTDGVIELTVKDIYKPEPVVLPEDADNKQVTYTIADPTVASFYQANIVAHKAGETTMTVTARDGYGATTTVKLIVKPQDRTPYEGYEDGTFILNEEWFGHTNGDMNFLTADTTLMYRVYERENAGEAFGATSCFGTIYGGKFYVTSKQAADGGDTGTKGGGRLVVMDAKTLKRLAGFDDIGGGDGRSVVGVSPSKVYLGTTAGIFTFDADSLKLGTLIPGTAGQSLYSGQIGDMIKAGRYVFALQQSKGLHIIDGETDRVVDFKAKTGVQGITQSADGNVWLATSDSLFCINPASLLTTDSLALPAGASISCSWGAWRPTPFCASRKENVLYWNGGSSMMGNGDSFYRWEIGTDLSTLQPFFTIAGLPADDPTKRQTGYGTIRYDDRTDHLIVMTTQSGWSTNYEHNWIHLVDGRSGVIEKTIALKPYYWFQALPIFPDKYLPEVDLPTDVVLQEGGEAFSIELAGRLTDRDNLAYNIKPTLADAGDGQIVSARLENGRLIIAPVGEGSTDVVMSVESNGRVVAHTLNVRVDEVTGIAGADVSRRLVAEHGVLVVEGYNGWTFTVYDAAGRLCSRFVAEGTAGRYALPATQGVYVLRGTDGKAMVSQKLIVR